MKLPSDGLLPARLDLYLLTIQDASVCMAKRGAPA